MTAVEQYREFIRLRAQGLTNREIADLFGLSLSTVQNRFSDPDGSKQKVRKAGYGGSCARCGRSTHGSNGPGKAPRLCQSCYREENRPEHGTVSRYHSGCGCDACREANRVYHASLKNGAPAQHGTMSGYANYGCRCRRCKRAWSEYRWRDGYRHQRAYAERHGGPCVDCGAPRSHRATRCRSCAARERWSVRKRGCAT